MKERKIGRKEKVKVRKQYKDEIFKSRSQSNTLLANRLHFQEHSEP